MVAAVCSDVPWLAASIAKLLYQKQISATLITEYATAEASGNVPKIASPCSPGFRLLLLEGWKDPSLPQVTFGWLQLVRVLQPTTTRNSHAVGQLLDRVPGVECNRDGNTSEQVR